MTLHNQWRLLIVRPSIIRILRRIKEPVRRQPAFRRELDRPWHREILRIRLEIVRATQSLELLCAKIEFHDRYDVSWRATTKHRLTISRSQKLDVRVRTINR